VPFLFRIRPAGAVHLQLESFERRDFVVWQGAQGDAVQAPLALRNAVQNAKDQARAVGGYRYPSMA
jgi:hypothetical protein